MVGRVVARSGVASSLLVGSISFVLTAWFAAPEPAAHAEAYGAFYGTHFLQAGSLLVPYPGGAAAWECWSRGVPPGEVTRTSVRTPLQTLQTVPPDADGAYVGMWFPLTTSRDALFPPGTYQIIETLAAGGARTNTLTLASAAYPPAPTLQDTASWSQWPAGQPLPVAWQPGVGTLPTDTFVVLLQDTSGFVRYFQSSFPGQTNALTGTANSFTIPGEYLATNGMYYVKVACYRSSGNGATRTGQFAGTLGALQVIGTTTGEVSSYRFLTGWIFTQEGTHPPALLSSNAYRAEALLRSRSAGRITAASVQAPGQTLQSLQADSTQLVWAWSAEYPAEVDLTAAWPNGGYHWMVSGLMAGIQETEQAITVGAWPSPLSVLDPMALRTNTFENDTLLTWTPPADATDADRVELVVMSSSGYEFWRTPDPLFDPPLPGTTNRIFIGAHTLPFGIEMIGCLRFIHVDSDTTNTLGGAEALAGRFVETRFAMGQTVPLPIPDLEVLTTNLPDATVAENYEAQLAASGGTRPYTWTLISGALPPGITLATDGSLRGLPLSTGTFPVSVRVTDSQAGVSEKEFSMLVAGTVPALSILSTNLNSVAGDWPYLAELASAGGAPPYTWDVVAGGLPPGLALDGAHGLIAGQPGQAGDYSFTVRLSDGSGQSQQRTFSLPVSAVSDQALKITGFNPTLAGVAALTLNAQPGDPVAVEYSSNCVDWVQVLAADYPTNGGLSWNALATHAGFFRARWGQAAPPPNPTTAVVPVGDTNLVVSGVLTGTNSLSLSLTNGRGEIYRLDLPTNAALHEVAVQMQFVPELGNSPFPEGYYGGVEFRPGGLGLAQAATLTVTFPGGIPADYTPLAYDPGGKNPHLCVALIRSNTVVFPILHFSGAGGSKATCEQANQYNYHNPPCPLEYVGEQLLAAYLRTVACNGGSSTLAEDAAPYLKQWLDWSVWPGLKQAQTDETVLDYAVREYLAWERAMELLGAHTAAADLEQHPPTGGYTPNQLVLLTLQRALEKAPLMMARGYANAIVKTHVRAVQETDAWIALNLFDYARAAQLQGLEQLLPSYLSTEAVLDRFSRIWRFELEAQSVIDVITAEGGQFVEQVRSGRCPVEVDPVYFTGSVAPSLQRGYQTNVDMVSWEYITRNGDRMRPVISRGSLQTFFLKVDPVYPEDTGDGNADKCREPKAPKFPVDARIRMVFNVGDPVKSMLVRDKDGNWRELPVGTSWEKLLKGLHALKGEFYTGVSLPGVEVPGDCFVIDNTWQYAGGRLFAEATYAGPADTTVVP
ncbi:MAG: putative Ig domain-containing protein, partial [Verrucomicrobia bacterium]|nr:putative Ig domain-containing protein [Verrucomicrobiota bacterium]